jgi:hypothetical protein
LVKNAYRLRERNEPNNRIKYLKRDEIIYARTKADQRRWHPAETQFIVEQLDQTDKMIVRVCTRLCAVGAGCAGMFTRRKGQFSRTLAQTPPQLCAGFECLRRLHFKSLRAQRTLNPNIIRKLDKRT